MRFAISRVIKRLAMQRDRGGSIRTEITGVEDYAQAVQPGDIFIVRKGKKTSGSRFVKEALARGAAAIVSEEVFLCQL